MRTPEEMAYAVVKMTIALGNKEKPQELAHALIALLAAWRDECVEVLQGMLVTRNEELMSAEAERDMLKTALTESLMASAGRADEIVRLRTELSSERIAHRDEEDRLRAENEALRSCLADCVDKELDETDKDSRIDYVTVQIDKSTYQEALNLSMRVKAGPPCPKCGYNGPGYYQPETHFCAKGETK